MYVKDVMKTDVVTVRPETTLKEVAALLVEHCISGVPVVDESGVVVGVVSEADILVKERGGPARKSFLGRLFDPESDPDDLKLGARTAGEAMTSPVITVPEHRSVAETARMMLEFQVNRLPVVHLDRLVGIVTRADLVKAFARSDEEIAREIRDDVLGRILMLPDPEAVEVTIAHGEVVLRGSVDRRYEAEDAASFVAKVPGVVSVGSTLTWREENGSR